MRYSSLKIRRIFPSGPYGGMLKTLSKSSFRWMPPGSRRNLNWHLFTAILKLLKPSFKKRYRTSLCNLLLMTRDGSQIISVMRDRAQTVAVWGVTGHSSVFLAGWYVIFYVHNAWRVNFLLDFRDWWISFETRSTEIKNRYSWYNFLFYTKRTLKAVYESCFFQGSIYCHINLLHLHLIYMMRDG